MANETMEYVMLHEVQSAFLDMQGVYLKWDDTNPGKRVYAISKDLQPSTFHFVSRILPCVSDLETLRSCCSAFLSFKLLTQNSKNQMRAIWEEFVFHFFRLSPKLSTTFFLF